MWEYSEKVLDHYRNPRNVGKIDDADLIGEAGSLACGDSLKLYIKLDGEKIKSFCIDKKNYIAVAVLCLVFIVVLACLTGNNGKTKSEEVTESSTDTQAQAQAQDTEISSDIVNNFVFDPEFEKDKNDDFE